MNFFILIYNKNLSLLAEDKFCQKRPRTHYDGILTGEG